MRKEEKGSGAGLLIRYEVPLLPGAAQIVSSAVQSGHLVPQGQGDDTNHASQMQAGNTLNVLEGQPGADEAFRLPMAAPVQLVSDWSAQWGPLALPGMYLSLPEQVYSSLIGVSDGYRQYPGVGALLGHLMAGRSGLTRAQLTGMIARGQHLTREAALLDEAWQGVPLCQDAHGVTCRDGQWHLQVAALVPPRGPVGGVTEADPPSGRVPDTDTAPHAQAVLTVNRQHLTLQMDGDWQAIALEPQRFWSTLDLDGQRLQVALHLAHLRAQLEDVLRTIQRTATSVTVVVQDLPDGQSFTGQYLRAWLSSSLPAYGRIWGVTLQ